VHLLLYFTVIGFVPEASQTRRAAVFFYALRQYHLFAVAESLCIVGHPRDRFTRSYLSVLVLVQPFVGSLHQLSATNPVNRHARWRIETKNTKLKKKTEILSLF